VSVETIAVQVAWSPAQRETAVMALTLPAAATLADALAATGWPALASAAVGDKAFAEAGLSAAVWGKARPLGQPLRHGDRVEVLRGLLIDPMSARRVRFEAAGGVDALRRRGYAGRKLKS
jgi:putative ubiquitin-RnfH superfamily antitoxin RatB of RatAB toxin-antitoxin module